MTYSIPMQPKGFPRLRRLIWTIRCTIEFRRRLNGEVMYRGPEPWLWSFCWQMAEASAESEADSNDAYGWAWSTPTEAVQNELECWTE